MSIQNSLCSNGSTVNISDTELLKKISDSLDMLDVLSQNQYDRQEAYKKILNEVIPDEMSDNIQESLKSLDSDILDIPTDTKEIIQDTLNSLDCLSETSSGILDTANCLAANASTSKDGSSPISPILPEEILRLPGNIKGALNRLGGFPNSVNLNWSLSLLQTDFGMPSFGNFEIVEQLKGAIGDGSLLKEAYGIVENLRNDVVGTLANVMSNFDLSKLDLKEIPIIGQAQELMKTAQPVINEIQKLDQFIEYAAATGNVNPLIDEAISKVSGTIDKLGLSETGCFDIKTMLSKAYGVTNSRKLMARNYSLLKSSDNSSLHIQLMDPDGYVNGKGFFNSLIIVGLKTFYKPPNSNLRKVSFEFDKVVCDMKDYSELRNEFEKAIKKLGFDDISASLGKRWTAVSSTGEYVYEGLEIVLNSKSGEFSLEGLDGESSFWMADPNRPAPGGSIVSNIYVGDNDPEDPDEPGDQNPTISEADAKKIINNLTETFNKSQEIKSEVIDKYDEIIREGKENDLNVFETTDKFDIDEIVPNLPNNVDVPYNILDQIPVLEGVIDPKKINIRVRNRSIVETATSGIGQIKDALKTIPNLDIKMPDISDKLNNLLKDVELPSIGMNDVFKPSAIMPPVFTQANDFFKAPSKMDDLISPIKSLVPTAAQYTYPDEDPPTPYDGLLDGEDYLNAYNELKEELENQKESWLKDNPEVGESWPISSQEENLYNQTRLIDHIKFTYFYLDRISDEDRQTVETALKDSVQKNIIEPYTDILTDKTGTINIIFTVLYADKYDTPIGNIIFETGLQVDVLDISEQNLQKKIIENPTDDFKTESYKKTRFSMLINNCVQEIKKFIYPDKIIEFLDEDITKWMK